MKKHPPDSQMRMGSGKRSFRGLHMKMMVDRAPAMTPLCAHHLEVFPWLFFFVWPSEVRTL